MPTRTDYRVYHKDTKAIETTSGGCVIFGHGGDTYLTITVVKDEDYIGGGHTFGQSKLTPGVYIPPSTTKIELSLHDLKNLSATIKAIIEEHEEASNKK